MQPLIERRDYTSEDQIEKNLKSIIPDEELKRQLKEKKLIAEITDRIIKESWHQNYS